MRETADSAPPGSSEASIMKGQRCGSISDCDSYDRRVCEDAPAQLAQHALSLPEVCPLHGGAPIKFEGEVVGSAGVSDGSCLQGTAISLAAAANVK